MRIRTERLPWALGGLGFLVLTTIGLASATLLSSSPYPSPFGSPLGPDTDVLTFFVVNRTQVTIMSFAYALGALALLAFVAYGAGDVAGGAEGPPDARETRSTMPMLAIGAGTLAAGFWLLTGLLLWVLAHPEATASTGALRVLHDLVYLSGGPAHVVTLGTFMAAVSLGAWRTHSLPRWVALIGLMAGVISVLSLAALLWDPASLILPLGRGLGFLWIVATSIAALRSPAAATDRGAGDRRWDGVPSSPEGLRS